MFVKIASFNGFGSQVNTNGILSFQHPFTQFSPRRFPLNNLIPLVAPFWDDVDIRRFGNIFYREISNVTLLQRAPDQLQELFPSFGNLKFTPTTLFIVTWDRVAEFGGGSQVSAYMTICCYWCSLDGGLHACVLLNVVLLQRDWDHGSLL